MNSKIRKVIKEALGEVSFGEKLQKLYEKYQKLETKYNSYSLDQLKNDYELKNIIDEVYKLNDEFNILKKQTPDDYEDKIQKLQKLKDSFTGDLEELEGVFKLFGDLDKTSVYFKKIIL